MRGGQNQNKWLIITDITKKIEADIMNIGKIS
jgi:hypothetical protein